MRDTSTRYRPGALVRFTHALPINNHYRKLLLRFCRALQRRFWPADWMRS